ncbi:type III secretion system translocon subunit SctB [Noviherbaspirillum sp.]|uniref:type III secretion system translocon subunit SctB n=1 Tax=Noviherbaspirillum sp. TaxID=1926288 RepID=UPI002B480CE9|nr:type III secretion system translocon subunit SctB [Noviherbaspirillum sp.]HJV80585.1 type III secretion system translocon subunit SctB [Noviherbaspirillum sp.]
MVSSVTSTQNIYYLDGIGDPKLSAPRSGQSDQAPPPPSSVAESDLSPPNATDGPTQAHILELGFAFEHTQTDIEDVMKLLYDFASKTRQAQKAIRQSELRAQVEVLLSAAQKLKDAAEANFKAAIISGAMGIAAGALGIACNAYGLKSSMKSISTDKKIAGLESKLETLRSDGVATKEVGKRMDAITEDIAKLNELSKRKAAHGMIWPGMGMGVSQMVSSAGDVAAAPLKREADLDTADSKKLDALATTHQALSEHAAEWVREMQDLMQDLLQKMQALIQLQHDTNSKIAS